MSWGNPPHAAASPVEPACVTAARSHGTADWCGFLADASGGVNRFPGLFEGGPQGDQASAVEPIARAMEAVTSSIDAMPSTVRSRPHSR